MAEYIYPAAVLLIAFSAACAIALGAIGSLQITRTRSGGIMHYFFVALVLANGIAISTSSRNFSTVVSLADLYATYSPIATWAIRLTSLLALIACADQIARGIGKAQWPTGARLTVGVALLAFWVSNMVIPAFFSANPVRLQLNWVYTPILGIGLLLLSAEAAEKCVIYCRNMLVLFCTISLLLVPVKSGLVLDYNYSQGFLPGVPRFAGLAPHAVVMGLLAGLTMWLLLAHPLKNRLLQVLAIMIALVALLLAQAKGAWLTVAITLPLFFLYQRRVPGFSRVAASPHRWLVVAGFVLLALLLVAGAVLLTTGSLGDKVERFLASGQGSQLASMTGRDRIWEVAIDEWLKSPLFGYGLPLFSMEHQLQIGMLYATHGHNQIIDGLGRSGLVGTSFLIVYVVLLGYYSFKAARASRGLSAVLFMALLVRMVSEVPLALSNLSLEALTHYVLLVTIAAHAPPWPVSNRKEGHP